MIYETVHSQTEDDRLINRFADSLSERKVKVTKRARKAPSVATMERWMNDGSAKAVDGCGGVEPDGHCEHGKPSWLLELGFI